eukprot:COSAG01_NODE_74190_length_223_cov_76.185484_1_plen_28_part_10
MAMGQGAQPGPEATLTPTCTLWGGNPLL